MSNIKDAFIALALGDALGVTSEFAPLEEIRLIYNMNYSTGWPFKCAGGGPFGFRAYHPTGNTEMAAAIVTSWKKHQGEFKGEQIAKNFITWMNSGPRDIGITTQDALTAVKNGTAWWEGGRALWEADPHAWSNGSLMRNGVVHGMGYCLVDVFDNTLHHGMITHWAPLPAICCALQSWLLNDPYAIIEDDWRQNFRRDWEFWMVSTEDPLSKKWLDLTRKDQAEAWQVFAEADFDMHSFRPFDEIEHMGFCLTTLQIAVWAMQWAMSDETYPAEYLPKDFPLEPFQRTGKDVIGWVAMIGRDADTYGATAGPLISIWKGVDEEQTRFLQGLNLIYDGNDIVEREIGYKEISLKWLFCAESEYGLVSEKEDFKGVIKVITDAHTIVFLENFIWESSHELAFEPTPFKVLRDPSEEDVAVAIASAIKVRQGLNIVCRYCHELCPPWHTNGDDTCHTCATRVHGVVY